MEILRSNFDDRLALLSDAINQCDFVSFDGEFSGIGDWTWNPFDSPQMLYSKCKKSVERYMLMQLGLCTFKYNSHTNSFTYKAFNIYLFPRIPKNLRHLRKVIIDSLDKSMQTDSINFLSDRDFDFNKWIKEGVNYIRDAERTEMEDDLNARFAKTAQLLRGFEKKTVDEKKGEPIIPDSLKKKIGIVWKEVCVFLDNAEDGDSLKFDDLNGSERKVLLRLCDHFYGPKCFRETDQIDGIDCGVFVIRKCRDLDQKIQFLKEKNEIKLDYVREAEGFTKIIKVLSESGKPIVGHNVKMDVMQLVETFISSLPAAFTDFQKLVHSTLSSIYDTKTLAQLPPLDTVLVGSALTDLVIRVKNDNRFPKIAVEPFDKKFGYDVVENPGMHDAGFDAYSTGVLFISMCGFIGDKHNVKRGTCDIPWSLLEPYENLISCGGKHQIMPGLHLVHPNKFDADHIFRIEFEAEWKKENIEALFRPCGRIRIYWINDTSAFVTLIARDNSEKAVKLLTTANNNKCKVETVARFVEREERIC